MSEMHRISELVSRRKTIHFGELRENRGSRILRVSNPALSHFLTSLPFLFHPVASTLLGRVTLCLIQKTFIYRTGPERQRNVWTLVYRTANPDKWSCIYAAVDRRVRTHERRRAYRTNREIHFQSPQGRPLVARASCTKITRCDATRGLQGAMFAYVH